MSAEQPPRVDTQIARPSQNTLFQSPNTLDTATIRPASILISPTDSSKRNSRRPPSRVIRTFEEKHVTTTVSAEEWYEELECGVCAHVLGAPQVLVPCGHSLCGPCAWEWIKKNKNLTCPHCRHQLHEAMPFVPNIVVDQIIERKLQSLPETPAKVDIMVERKDKAEAWKLVQAALKPPVPRRRNFDDTVFGLFGVDNNAHRQSQHQRRASRHLPELGPPVPSQSQPRPAPQSARRPTHPYGTGMNLAEIRRHEVEEQHLPSRAEIRRLREASIRDQQAHQLAMRILEEEVAAPPESERPPVSIDSRLSPPAPTVPYTANAAQRRERTNSGTPIGPRPPNSRAPGSRSRVLADRQARGRGSRETPLVVLTDSE